MLFILSKTSFSILALFYCFLSTKLCNGGSAVFSPLVDPSPTADKLSQKQQEFIADMTEDDIMIPAWKKGFRARFTQTYLWENGVIPFIVDSSLASDPARMSSLSRSIQKFHEYTCLRFQPRKNEADYVRFMDGGPGRCYSYVGRVGGEQDLSIGSGCELRLGIVMHEMEHALGMLHEQSRPDRDSFVTIVNNAIQDGKMSQFEKFTTEFADTLNFPYDYASMMHYSARSFSKDGQITIVTKDSSVQELIGQREGFSACDLAKLNRLYNCRMPNNPPCGNSETPTTTTTTKPSSTSTTRPQTTNANKCIDIDPECPKAKLIPDLCVKYPGRFMTYCPLTCGNCDGSICIDSPGLRCDIYGNHCKDYESVRLICPRTCGLCGKAWG